MCLLILALHVTDSCGLHVALLYVMLYVMCIACTGMVGVGGGLFICKHTIYNVMCMHYAFICKTVIASSSLRKS